MEDLSHKQLQKMIIFSCERIKRDKEQINKINVFPVPDQDTGSNLSATLDGVKKEITEKDFKNAKELGDAVLDGALTAAQGNTGIIYTGFMVGFFSEIDENTKLDNKTLSNAFQNGYERARESIQDPKEGTILDVMKAFAESLKKNKDDIVEGFTKGLKNADKALAETQNKMEILKKADVVDAGGLGFLMILETYLDTLLEQANPLSLEPKKIIESESKRFIQVLSNRFEVIALLSDTEYVPEEIRRTLQDMGDCLDIIQVKDKTKIHIHTDLPYEVRDIIKTFGEVDSVRIEDMAKQIAGEESVQIDRIGLVVDELCGLTDKIINHYDIESLHYDKKDIEGTEMFSIKESSFEKAFRKQLENFEEVVCITSGQRYSESYKSALKAQHEIGNGNIHVIDSETFSAGQALLTLKAIDLIQEQKKGRYIEEKLNALKKNVRCLGIIGEGNTLGNPKIEKTLKAHKTPLVKINKEVRVLEVIKEEKTVERIFKNIENKTKKDIKNQKGLLVVIIHNNNEEKAKEVKKELKKLKAITSFIKQADPIMQLHLGEKGLLIGYIAI